ncbi:MAG: hypothetical protein U0174_19330 [Polyangiaceae bacterium]
MNTTHTPQEARTSGQDRRANPDRREERFLSDRRLVERRGMLASMADALEDILRAEVRAGLYREPGQVAAAAED